MSEQKTKDASSHEPSGVKDIRWWLVKLQEDVVVILFLSIIVGGVVFWIQGNRYKDIVEGLKTQIGTQAATIKNEDATIVQLREQLKGTSPQLAAIQASRDKIRSQLQKFYVQGGELFRRQITDEATLKKWVIEANSWVASTSVWITEHMGEAATEKFVDQGSTPDVSWGDSFNQQHTNARNVVARFRRNLSTLIETAAWDGAIK